MIKARTKVPLLNAFLSSFQVVWIKENIFYLSEFKVEGDGFTSSRNVEIITIYSFLQKMCDKDSGKVSLSDKVSQVSRCVWFLMFSRWNDVVSRKAKCIKG